MRANNLMPQMSLWMTDNTFKKKKNHARSTVRNNVNLAVAEVVITETIVNMTMIN